MNLYVYSESQITGFFTTDSNIDSSGGAMDAFVAAMEDAFDFWDQSSNFDAYAQSISDHTGADIDAVKSGRQLKHYKNILKESVQKQGDILAEFGKITAAVPDACDDIGYGH